MHTDWIIKVLLSCANYGSWKVHGACMVPCVVTMEE